MGKNNVLIYTEWLEDLEDIGDMESGILFQNILRYQIGNMDLLPMDRVTNTVFRNIRRCIDRDNKAYEAKCEKNKKISKEYWEKIKAEKEIALIQTDSNDTERIRTISDNEKDKDKEKDNENEKEKDKDKDLKEKEKEKGKGKVTRKRTTKNKTIYDIDLIEREVLCNKIAYPRQG